MLRARKVLSTTKRYTKHVLTSCSDLRACFDLPSSCLQDLKNDFPLPNYSDDEIAEATFLAAEVHLRQLINNKDTQCEDGRPGIDLPQNIPGAFPEDEIPPGKPPEEPHNSLLRRTSRLLCQLDDLLEQLPREIKPSLEVVEATSDQTKMLRARYYAARIALQRPLLLYASEEASSNTPVPLLEACEACVEDCRIFLLSMSQVLRKRSPYLWTLSQT